MGRSRHQPADIDAVVVGLVDRVTRRMRTAERTGRTVVLRLRFDDFTRVSRSHTLLRATASTDTILATVRGLVAAAMPMIEARGLTLVGIAVGNLDDHESLQLELPFDQRGPIAADFTMAVSIEAAAGRWTPHSTASATASARRPSPGRCCSGAIRACRCRCCRI